MGLDRRQGPGLPLDAVRHRAGRAEHGEHDAGGDPGGHRGERQGHRRHHPRHLRAVPRGAGRHRGARCLVRRRRPAAGGRGRREVRSGLERTPGLHEGRTRTARSFGGLR
ncbi:hypothetical protein SBRY_21008 [Actinacidiphila bryophytorum]|uniref:Uncharacterized protein n=1 Tax=Actinacidiphila bryophytorum TaxID=1436133 RepID=A0A9W4EDZ0_9ACTN|nr:hypothetical protein SBRY_21008 [Actinacidiphila bryophytorum]